MPTMEKTPSERVDELLELHRHQPFRHSMGTVAAIAELINRTKGLELAIHVLTEEVERLKALVASERH